MTRALVLLAAVAATACAPRDEGPLRFPDAPLMIVSIDTLRADRLGCYGYDRDTSPAIDAIAAEGIVFEDVYSHSPKTASSHMSLFSSLLPTAHGVTNASARLSIPVRSLAADRPTLPEVLAEAGYRGTAFASGGNIIGRMGFERGFDGRFSSRNMDVGDLVDRVLARLSREKGEAPAFTFVHTYQVHGPYVPPPEFMRRFAGAPRGLAARLTDALRGLSFGEQWGAMHSGLWDHKDEFGPEDAAYLSDLYDAEIAYTDSQLARLFDWLRTSGRLDRMVLVILSDHGEEFAEHGDYEHDQLFREHLHVPLIVRLPGGARGGTRVAGLAGLVDVMPTVLDLLGLEAPDGIAGRSLVPAIRTGATDDRPVLAERVMFADDYRAAWRTPDSNTVYHARDGVLRAFDLRADPGETEDVAGRAPFFGETSARLRDELARLWARRGEVPEGAGFELDAAQREELRQLGYLEGGGDDDAVPAGHPLENWPR